jgi:ubiquinone/menaquinone biosynthesis C-methylase UbiE
MQAPAGYDSVVRWLGDPAVHTHVVHSLSHSLHEIGFGSGLGDFERALLGNLKSVDFDSWKSFDEDLDVIYDAKYWGSRVPLFMEKYVFPHVDSPRIVLDVGCGTGILLYRLCKSSDLEQAVGIDLMEYPQWTRFYEPNLEYRVVDEQQFPTFLRQLNPDTVFLTYSLHHMEYAEQPRYLATLHRELSPEAKLYLLEDSYSQAQPATEMNSIGDEFMHLSPQRKQSVMSVLDWVANRLLARRWEERITFAYRTLEEWIGLAQEIGFDVSYSEFIGFPEKRDINTPQSLLLLQKPMTRAEKHNSQSP